jgi:hypothetical protein
MSRTDYKTNDISVLIKHVLMDTMDMIRDDLEKLNQENSQRFPIKRHDRVNGFLVDSTTYL